MNLSASNKDAVILVIDDDEKFLDLIKETLVTAGFKNIFTSSNPNLTVSLFTEYNPDVVLLDLHMPSLDGFDVITKLKDECNAEYLPVMILTDEDGNDVKVKLLQHGAKGIINKSLDTFELIARINVIVSMSTYYKELILKNKSLSLIVQEQTEGLMHATKRQEEAEQKLKHNLLRDSITGLSNRYLFEERLEQLISLGEKNNANVAVIVLGFDNHSEISSVIGHQAYNELLQKITAKLKEILRTSDTASVIQNTTSGTALSRIGEDLFAIIVPIFQTLNDIDKVIGRCASSLLEPIDLSDIMFDIVLRGGVSYFPEHGNAPDDLIQHANIALYHAREENEDYKIYDTTYDDVSKYRLSLMAELKIAIAEDNLELFYQPKIDMTSNTLKGCEALVRWQHLEYGSIPPDSFIPMAEKTGTIRLLTIWVIKNAMQQSAKWSAMGIHLTISINLSAQDLGDISIVSLVKEKLEKYNVNPNNIILEVTESSTMQDPNASLNILNQLSKLGVTLSIDDYGTGYSSLAYLRSLPVNEIKIDKSFVINMDNDKDNKVIVKSTIELAHNLGYRVVAEGIENELIYTMLKSYGCDIGQGFFMSRPITVVGIEKLFSDKKWKLS